ncbi:MAG: type II toxin-antitoxin system VapC family toxin [Candidatus Bathyarchaeia archaeon]
MDYVVDASVIVKWFIPEEESEKARKLKDLLTRGEVNLYSPQYSIVEVANALTLHHIVKLSEDDITDAILSLEKMLTLANLTHEEWRIAIKLAREIPTAVYDSAYLALSLKMNVKLVTADYKLYARLPDSLRSYVVLLRDLHVH